MLNLFAAVANGLGRMLPGYMQGRQQAIRDNWYDLNQYNQVQQGQLQNAWSEQTFEPMLNRMWAATAMDQYAANAMGLQDMLNWYAAPGRLAQTALTSFNAPGLTQARIADTLGQYSANAWNRQQEQQYAPLFWDELARMRSNGQGLLPFGPAPQQVSPDYEGQVRQQGNTPTAVR